MRIARFALVAVLVARALAAEPVTVVEATGYARTSLYAEVLDFLYQVEKTSSLVAIAPLATSTEGRMVPLVILSKEHIRTPNELRDTGKPAVLIMANIHAGEVEGKEACQMLTREVGSGRLAGLLEHQVILVIPIFNADGNDKLGKNRHDTGPELAGVRFNGQSLDLNRDYTKLESPEVTALVRLFNTWDPVLVVDMHTTNGSYHREPVSFTTCANANGPKALADYMWKKLFPEAAARLKKESGFDSVPYGEFVEGSEPSKGWINEAIEARYGTNYVGLRNRLSILDENYSYADFKTRVLASFAYIRAVLEFTDANAGEIAALVKRVDHETATAYFRQPFATETTLEKLRDVTVKGWEFTTEPVTPEEKARHPWEGDVKVIPTDVPRDYTVPYLALAVPKQTVPLPTGYLVLPGQEEVVANLQTHGIVLQKLVEGCRMPAERFVIEKIEPAKTVFQGHVQLSLTGHYEKIDFDVPAGSLFVDMRQPLARLIPVLLEPLSSDSLAVWGFLNRVIVRQWSAEPAPYPVLRVETRPPVPLLLTNVY
ncbi:MAG TPA: M14 family metallopeptidase [Thermoanaerobaculaceae bacterium]|nr:M14 family metallopeptidase [Thermoanaerobaculaceae bacterium]